MARDTFCLSARVPGGADARAQANRDFFFDALDEMGIGMLRHGMHWHEVEPQPGAFNFANLDLQVEQAHARGVKLIGLLGYGNRWASALAEEKNDPFYPPEDPNDFAQFAAEVAQRYLGRVNLWEIWNEQNAGYRFWKSETSVSGDPDAYGALLKATYSAIKEVDPDSVVSFGGLFYIPQVILGAEEFTKETYLAHPDIGDYFDTFSYHPYAFYPPIDPPEWSETFEDADITLYPVDETARRLGAILADEGNADKPLWVTEIGWPTEGAVDEITHANYMVRSFALLLSEGVEAICWYTFFDGDPSRDFLASWEEFFGLYTYDIDPTDGDTARGKPIVATWKLMNEVLGELRFAENEDLRYQLEEDAYLKAFSDPAGERIVHVGWTLKAETTIRIPSRKGKKYKRVKCDCGATDPVPVGPDGLLEISLSPAPIYLIEEPE